MLALIIALLIAADPDPDDDVPEQRATLIIMWQAPGATEWIVDTYPEPGMTDCQWDAQQLLTSVPAHQFRATCVRGWDLRT